MTEQLLNENLAKLTSKFEKATADKLKCQQEAESTARTISLANRLVRRGAAGGRRHTHTHTYLSTESLPFVPFCNGYASRCFS